MKNKTKHLLTAGILVIFALFAISSRVNKIPYGAFNYSNRVEEPTSGNCLVRNDGTKIFGRKIFYATGLLASKTIKIDDQRFPMSEIKGYYQDGAYYGLAQKEYGKRIIHGKLNVYVEFKQVTSTTTTGNYRSTRTYMEAFHYAQQGEDGPMIPLGSKATIKKVLEACPLAVEMINNRTHKDKKNPNFLNHVFDVYNAGCKEPADSDSTAIRLQ